MPIPWCAGSTETGPNPNQPEEPSEIVTGENAMWPKRLPSSLTATVDNERSPEERRRSTMSASVPSLCSAFSNAAVVTLRIASSSPGRSSLRATVIWRANECHSTCPSRFLRAKNAEAKWNAYRERIYNPKPYINPLPPEHHSAAKPQLVSAAPTNETRDEARGTCGSAACGWRFGPVKL